MGELRGTDRTLVAQQLGREPTIPFTGVVRGPPLRGEPRGTARPRVPQPLGREPTVPFTVVVRCPGGHPLVIRNAPVDAQGNPFPTLFWLTCPDAARAASRLESEGWVARLGERLETDPAVPGGLAPRGRGRGRAAGRRQGIQAQYRSRYVKKGGAIPFEVIGLTSRR